MRTEREIPELSNLNLDSLDLSTLETVANRLQILTRYAEVKSLAMRQRLAGQIDQALEHERRCEALYGHLPEAWKW